MGKLAEYLNRHVVGNVFDTASIREAYSTDRSPFEIEPRLVALPENPDDVRRLLRFVHQLSLRGLHLPVTARGTGLDKTGATIGPGLIISLERMNQIEEIDLRGRLVRVQPGLTLGELNSALALQGLWLPVNHHPRSTIGGLIANCPNDAYANRYGGIYRAVERVEVVLSSGDLIQLAPYHQHAINAKIATNDAEGQLYKNLEHLLDDQADTILDRAMQPFDAKGYANITRVREGHTTNLLPLIFGSQGTLGIITDVILHVEPLPSSKKRLLASFHDAKQAQRFLSLTADLDPYVLNLYDLRILETAAALGKKSDLFTEKFGGGFLILVGFDGRRADKSLRACLSALPASAHHIIETPENTSDFRELDSLLLAYLNDSGSPEAVSIPNRHTHSSPERTPVLDDVFIPAPNFNSFLEGLAVLEQTFDTPLPLFGSYLTSSYTIRPAFNFASLDDRHRLLDFLKLYGQLISTCGGSPTGNVPEGRLGSLINSQPFSVGERQVYTAIKTAFDPQNILGPGLKLDADPEDALRHFRTHPLGGVITP